MLYSLGDRAPEVAHDVYVAPSADVIGTVRLAAGASVWFNVVIRGDSDWIEIGEGTNVQDGTIIHTDGHKALLHSCFIGDETLIANGAMVLDRCSIGRHCVIAAGALIPPDKEIPEGSVVMGSPGKIVRQVNAHDLELIRGAAAHYRRRAERYRAALRPLGPPA
jgi:carbonic anhydrase/acetyltransferase-like protein (isoleucine patch superfamily)